MPVPALLSLFCFRRIYTFAQHLTCRRRLSPRFSFVKLILAFAKTPKSNTLFPALEVIAQPPNLFTISVNPQVKPAAVRILGNLASWFRLKSRLESVKFVKLHNVVTPIMVFCSTIYFTTKNASGAIRYKIVQSEPIIKT